MLLYYVPRQIIQCKLLLSEFAKSIINDKRIWYTYFYSFQIHIVYFIKHYTGSILLCFFYIISILLSKTILISSIFCLMSSYLMFLLLITVINPYTKIVLLPSLTLAIIFLKLLTNQIKCKNWKIMKNKN